MFAAQNQRLFITACGPQAERSGVRIGQPLAEAKTLIRNAHFLPADAATDREALRQLALDAQRFSPIVGLEDAENPESLLCDVTGCTHLWDGEERFLNAVRDYWSGRSFHTQLALAGSVGAAWALARAVTAAVVPVGEESTALAGLPVELLRLPLTALERLDALGLKTIRDVLQLPRDTLAGRFGVILPQRLDQALGLRPESFVGERLREALSVVREWETPLENRLDVALVCRRMLRTLLSMVHHPYAGLEELEGELRTETGVTTLEIRLMKPSRDERHLAQLVELQLERRAWPGGVVAIRWSVPRLGRFQEVEQEWFAGNNGTDASRHVDSLVERLSSRLGDDMVLRVEAVADALPECAFQFLPWTRVTPGRTNEPPLTPELWRCRPCRLFSVPQPLMVLSVIPDGPPILMTWLNEDHRVARCWGPERIATGWWRAADARRDYYRVEWEDGTHVWTFRNQRDGQWFLHGFFE